MDRDTLSVRGPACVKIPEYLLRGVFQNLSGQLDVFRRAIL